MSLQICCDWQRGQFRLSVDTTFPMQGITAIFGRSGSGKSSLLQLIAGLTRVRAARVQFQQQVWQQDRHFTALTKRRIGLVLQEPGLWPHLSVLQHLHYGFYRTPAALRRFEPNQIIAWLQLEDLLQLPVSHLSGGQKQRVALGRAILASPQLLLLDEPFAGLDGQSKNEMLPMLRDFVVAASLPVLLVSHDSREVEALADQLVFMEQGQVKAQQSLQQALLDAESPLFWQSEIASVLLTGPQFDPLQQGQSLYGQHHSMQDDTLQVSAPLTPDPLSLPRVPAAKRLRVLARDVSIALAPVRDISIRHQWPASITAITPYRQHLLVSLVLADQQRILSEISVQAATQLRLQVGQQVQALVKAVALS